MDDRLLDILACPLCKGPLKLQRNANVLVCRAEIYCSFSGGIDVVPMTAPPVVTAEPQSIAVRVGEPASFSAASDPNCISHPDWGWGVTQTGCTVQWQKLPVVAVVTKGRVYEKMLSNLEVVRTRGGKILAVAHPEDARVRALADEVLPVPETREDLAPIVNVVPLQLLAYHVALRRGCDVDQPRNLAKSVTVE